MKQEEEISAMKAKPDMELLNKAFETFQQASNGLGSSYQRLEKKAESLKTELDIKNSDLRKNLAEKEKVQVYLNNILENLTTGVIVVDLAGKATLFNRMAEVITDNSLEEIQDKGLPAVFGLHASQTSRSEDLTGMLKRLNDKTFQKSAGRVQRTIHISTTGLYEEAGPLIGGIIHLKDVTEIKRLEQQSERKNRLMAMGEMSAIIAHEIRNPLGGIELFADILRKELQNEPDREHLAENILVGVKSLNHILTNLLFYTRPLRPSCTLLPVRGIVEEALIFSELALRQNEIEWSCHHHGPDLEIMTDGELLKQIFMNLILNAVQAMPGGGKIRIETSVFEDEVECRFSDTGKGIKAEDLHKIFNPFFSTKGKGTGLGLAIVHQLVVSLGGVVRVESLVDEGTTFTLTFSIKEKREEGAELSVPESVSANATTQVHSSRVALTRVPPLF